MITRKILSGISIWILVVLMGLAPWPVFAQSNTSVSIDPAESTIQVGSTVCVSVLVLNGSSLNAFDLTLVYNPAILRLESWSFGNYLTNLMLIRKQDDPGSLTLAATQLARPGVTGDGSLLNLVFRAIIPGNSSVVIQNASLATGDGQLLYTELIPGMITTVAGITSTPTSTVVKAPTAMPTATVYVRPYATSTIVIPTTTPEPQEPKNTEGHNNSTPGTKLTATLTEHPDSGITLPLSDSGIGNFVTNTSVASGTTYASPPTTEIDTTSIEETNAGSITEEAFFENQVDGRILNTLLWGFAIFLFVIFIVLIFRILRRRKQK